MSDSASKAGPLAGVKIVDLTRVLSGPFCTMILGDMGAEVIKVEPPSGDPVREQGSIQDGLSWYFAGFNRNKKSIVLDLYTEKDKTALANLLKSADVLVENFRPGTLERMGFSADFLKTVNPDLIVASINGFGSVGPYADRPAFDFVVQAMSGFMSVNGAEGGDPMRAGPPVSDLLAGIYGALAIVSAYLCRVRTGQAQNVEVSMLNSLLSIMAYLSSEYFVTKNVPVRTGNDHPLVAPYGLYRCSGGRIAVAPSNDVMLGRFLKVLGLDSLLKDPRYSTNSNRFAAREELRELIEEQLEKGRQTEWIKRFNAAGVPCGKVMDLAEIFEDPHVVSQEMTVMVDHPGHGEVRMLGFPIKFSKTPCRVVLPAPRLGEHNFLLDL